MPNLLRYPAHMRTLALVSASLVLLVSCTVGSDDPARLIPADAVLLRVYTEGGEGGNGIPESVRWTFRSPRAFAQWGVVTHLPEGTCIVVGPQWTLSIDDNGRQVPLDHFGHAEFSGTSPLDLSIVRDARGRITVAEKLPDWMNGKPLGCAPLQSN